MQNTLSQDAKNDKQMQSLKDPAKQQANHSANAENNVIFDTMLSLKTTFQSAEDSFSV